MERDARPGIAAYASRPDRSRGRLIAESPSPTRSVFQRDRDRIVHSSAFRRLALKTQVFLPDAGDNYRTRLTHTIEVAQIARTIARALALDEDLTEALALAHDLGHPPFGHTGERALDICVKPAGGFDHNEQTLRIVTALERRYPDFDGLNLTWETLEGLIKRKGPLIPAEDDRNAATPKLRHFVRALALRMDLDLATYAGAEAQAAAVADDIAYNAHDLEDGLDAGLFACADLEAVPFLRHTLADITAAHPGLDRHAVVRTLTRTMIGAFVDDVVAESGRRLAMAAPKDPWALRALGHPVIASSAPLAAHSADVKTFLAANMYRHPRLAETRASAASVVRDLAELFVAAPERMPDESWRRAATGGGGPAMMRAVADCIAGMTDRGAVREHRRFFGTMPDLR